MVSREEAEREGNPRGAQGWLERSLGGAQAGCVGGAVSLARPHPLCSSGGRGGAGCLRARQGEWLLASEGEQGCWGGIQGISGRGVLSPKGRGHWSIGRLLQQEAPCGALRTPGGPLLREVGAKLPHRSAFKTPVNLSLIHI